MRKIVLDTETTGMNKRGDDVSFGHRIIEIACVEILDDIITGREFHSYVNPGRKIDKKAVAIHGIKDEFLKGKPKFKDIVKKLLDFIGDSEIIIHNAPFDIAFLDKEFRLLKVGMQPIGKRFKVFDTLSASRNMYPNQDNTLKALCNKFNVSQYVTHSALDDARMLAHVYLKMTGRHRSDELDFFHDPDF